MCFKLGFIIIGIVCGICCYAQRSATINKVWMEHNVTKGGKLGMVVHADFTVNGLKGEKVDCTAYFYDKYKNNLKTTYNGYKTVTGKACTWSYGNVTYDNSRWKDFDNFIPYEAMNLEAGRHEYYCKVVICDTDNNILGDSEYYSFTGTGSNTKRIYYDNGGYADETTNADGTITTVNYTPCNICRGRKVCNLCNGAGGMWGGYGIYRVYSICTSCGGSQQCKYCQGTGVSVFTTTYDPASNSSVSQDLWSGNTYVSGGYYNDDDDNSSYGSSSSRSSCSMCNGTGVDPFPWEDATSNVGRNLPWCYTNPSGKKCPYCKRYTWHQHHKCPKCNSSSY